MNKEKLIPNKLSQGDEIRVISPAQSMSIISPEVREIAIDRLASMGLRVSFAKHCEESDDFYSSSVKSRLHDLNEAFADPNVKGILTTIGGYNSIQLLSGIDYELIKKNPKFFCGYSDITTLQNAIFKETGLITFSGPHFSTFGCLKSLEYLIEYFQKCAFSDEPFNILPSPLWSDDEWYLNQEERAFETNQSYHVIRQGQAVGTIVGGNINALNALQGTKYFPRLEETILFLEDDYLTAPAIFDRCLQSLILQKDFNGVNGILIGRFQRASKMTESLLEKIILSKQELKQIPVIANVDFGHTLPMITFPIGGTAQIGAGTSEVTIHIKKN